MKLKKILLNIPEADLIALKKSALKRVLSVSALIREAISDYLKAKAKSK